MTGFGKDKITELDKIKYIYTTMRQKGYLEAAFQEFFNKKLNSSLLFSFAALAQRYADTEEKGVLHILGLEEDRLTERDYEYRAGGTRKELAEEIKAKVIEELKPEEPGLCFCQAVGAFADEGGGETEIYYLAGLKREGTLCIDYTFPGCIIRSYAAQVARCIASARNMSTEEQIGEHIGKQQFCIVDEAAAMYGRYMLDLFGIDLGLITEVAASYYEGSACRANLIFAPGYESEEGHLALAFDAGIDFRRENVRRIRKLLEMGSERLDMIAAPQNGKWEILGLGRAEDFPFIRVRLLQHMVWELYMGNRLMVRYNCGRYSLETEEIEEAYCLRAFFNTFGDEPSGALSEMFRYAIKQQHGTTMVILEKEKMAEETERLFRESSGTKLKSENISPEVIQNATAIDGAVILDPDGNCCAIGVILDGSAAIEGQAARGARYNSARKYIATCAKNSITAMAVVVSEDRTVECISTAQSRDGEEKNGR